MCIRDSSSSSEHGSTPRFSFHDACPHAEATSKHSFCVSSTSIQDRACAPSYATFHSRALTHRVCASSAAVRAAREREAYFAGHIARAQKLERGDRDAQSKQTFALQPFSDRSSALESNVSVSHILVKHSQSRRLSSRIDPAGGFLDPRIPPFFSTLAL
eukprot:3941945-Rhodomonas_salina.3